MDTIDITETDKTTVRESKTILAEIDELHSKRNIIDKTVKNLLKELEKTIKSEQKEYSKKKKSSLTTSEKRDPSGFNAKQPVPEEFCCQPWGCKSDEEIARTKLTKMVYDYVRDNNLQNPKDRRIIFPDDAIKKLFHLNDNDELHFNNFQTYMKRLYNRNFNDKELSSDSNEESSKEEEEVQPVKEVKETKKKDKKKNKD